MKYVLIGNLSYCTQHNSNANLEQQIKWNLEVAGNNKSRKCSNLTNYLIKKIYFKKQQLNFKEKITQLNYCRCSTQHLVQGSGPNYPRLSSALRNNSNQIANNRYRTQWITSFIKIYERNNYNIMKLLALPPIQQLFILSSLISYLFSYILSNNFPSPIS